jgi:hypothetical protein
MTIRDFGKLAIALAAGLASAAHAQSAWTLKGATIYPAPDVPPIHDGRVIISGNRIQAVTGSTDARAPAPTKSTCISRATNTPTRAINQPTR